MQELTDLVGRLGQAWALYEMESVDEKTND